MDVRSKLFKLQDLEYKKFHSKLCPNVDKIIGIPIPKLKKIAKDLAKDNIIYKVDNPYYEEIMIEGLSISYGKIDLKEKLDLIDKFIDKIDNWAICDTIVASLKDIKKDKELVWNYVEKWLDSNYEFRVRFGIVIMLDYFIEDKYLDKVLLKIDKIKSDNYYINMAIAWLISICYIKEKERTFMYLNNNNLDNWTYNKAIQKIRESLRVSKNEKEKLKK